MYICSVQPAVNAFSLWRPNIKLLQTRRADKDRVETYVAYIYDAINQFESKCGHWKFWINSGLPVYTCIVLGFGFQSYSFYTKKLSLATDASLWIVWIRFQVRPEVLFYRCGQTAIEHSLFTC